MYRIIKTSSDNKKILKRIGEELLSLNLSPCIQISNKANSIYKWKNSIENSSEYILTIKTIDKYASKCYKIINEKHNYEIPEIIEINFSILNKQYKKWFDENI